MLAQVNLKTGKHYFIFLGWGGVQLRREVRIRISEEHGRPLMFACLCSFPDGSLDQLAGRMLRGSFWLQSIKRAPFLSERVKPTKVSMVPSTPSCAVPRKPPRGCFWEGMVGGECQPGEPGGFWGSRLPLKSGPARTACLVPSH